MQAINQANSFHVKLQLAGKCLNPYKLPPVWIIYSKTHVVKMQYCFHCHHLNCTLLSGNTFLLSPLIGQLKEIEWEFLFLMASSHGGSRILETK